MLLSPHVSKNAKQKHTKDCDVNGLKEGEGWRDWLNKNLDEDVVIERWRGRRG